MSLPLLHLGAASDARNDLTGQRWAAGAGASTAQSHLHLAATMPAPSAGFGFPPSLPALAGSGKGGLLAELSGPCPVSPSMAALSSANAV